MATRVTDGAYKHFTDFGMDENVHAPNAIV